MYCNMPQPQFTAGKRVRLHVMALGSQEDMHTPSIGGTRLTRVNMHVRGTESVREYEDAFVCMRK